MLFATAAKPLEIARLEVRDYLNADGSVGHESLLPGQAAINGEPRPLFFCSTRTIAAVDVYLAERIRLGQGISGTCSYRGLDPMCRLFLTDAGDAMRSRYEKTGIDGTIVVP